MRAGLLLPGRYPDLTGENYHLHNARIVTPLAGTRQLTGFSANQALRPSRSGWLGDHVPCSSAAIQVISSRIISVRLRVGVPPLEGINSEVCRNTSEKSLKTRLLSSNAS